MAISKSAARLFAGNPGAVLSAACAAAQREHFTIRSVDPQLGVVRLSSDMSLSSWGENLELHVRAVDAELVEVSVRSSLKFGLVDWGRNSSNIERLFGHIAALVTERPPAWHPDPTARHELRWWNGSAWTDSVADAGVAGTDPL